MNGFESGKVFGVADMEDGCEEMVFRQEAAVIPKSPVIPKGCNYPGKIITINRDCSKCAREIKLQVGSDLVFLDGKPYLLPMGAIIIDGCVLIDVKLFSY